MAVTGHQAALPASELATISQEIRAAAASLGPGPLEEDALRRCITPLFSRVLKHEWIYLANHSLGRPLDQTASDILEFSDAWYSQMDDAWGPWLDEVNAFRARVAVIAGLSRADAVVPKSSAGHALRTVLGAVRNPRPRVLATRGEFDSIDFILKVAAARNRIELHLVEPGADGLFAEADIIRDIDTFRPDVVVVSKVCYATGQSLDLREIVACAHAQDALVVVDAYHAIGVMPFDMESHRYDFAIGGAYKYLRGGPGPCFLAIHPSHLHSSINAASGELVPLDTGWFAKKDTFAFQRPDQPEFSEGGDAWLESTPIPALAYQARAGLQLIIALSLDRLRDYNLSQQEFLAGQLRDRRVPLRELPSRGAYLLVPHHDTSTFITRLKSRGVIADARLGHVRLCPDILTTQDEMTRAAAIIAEVIH
jgi:kynureninase